MVDDTVSMDEVVFDDDNVFTGQVVFDDGLYAILRVENDGATIEDASTHLVVFYDENSETGEEAEMILDLQSTFSQMGALLLSITQMMDRAYEKLVD